TAVTQDPRRSHIIVPADHLDLGTHETCVADPADDGYRNEKVRDAGTQHCDDRDHEHDKWEGDQDINDSHHNRVEPTPEVPGQGADGGADDQRGYQEPEGADE